MKFTIIPEDKLIIIDGLGYSPLAFKIDANIHAVQWYGEFGEIEYKPEMTPNGVSKPLNKSIMEYSAFEKVLTAWQKAHDLALTAQTTEVQNGD